MTDQDDRQRLLRREVARETIRDAALALGRHGIACAPIKGALLAVLFEDFDRVFDDVDLLVAPSDGERALGCLEQLGYRVVSPQPFATCLVHPGRPLPLDLHRGCFPPGLFDLDAAEVLSRASRDVASFGASVLRPDPRDLYALAVGNFAKDRVDTRAAYRLEDLALIATRFELDVEGVARHLTRHGLGRAGLYTLGLAEHLGDPFAGRVRRALPCTRTDALAVWLAGAWVGALPRATPLSAPASHLLNRSFGQGARSFAIHARTPLARRAAARLGLSKPRR